MFLERFRSKYWHYPDSGNTTVIPLTSVNPGFDENFAPVP
jgi:hypothetical protein